MKDGWLQPRSSAYITRMLGCAGGMAVSAELGGIAWKTRQRIKAASVVLCNMMNVVVVVGRAGGAV
jgi:hypothetical protein